MAILKDSCPNLFKPELSSILYIMVAAGLSLRFLSSDRYMNISRKLHNLKVAATI